MADNIALTEGIGPKKSVTEDLGGDIHIQGVKPYIGSSGNASPVHDGNPMPIKVVQSVLPEGAARYSRQPEVTTYNPDPGERGAAVRQVPAKQFNVSFAQVTGATGGLDTTDVLLRGQTGSMTHGQTGGNLVVATGTTANSELLLKFAREFKGPWIARAQIALSQRIANQNFAFVLADTVEENCAVTINSATSITVATSSTNFTATSVGQGIFVGNIQGANGVPGRYVIAAVNPGVSIELTVSGWPASGTCTADLFGYNYVWTRYSGTVATETAFDSQRRGWRSTDTTLTINTTASPGHIMQMANDTRTISATDVIVAPGATPVTTARGSRLINIPDDDLALTPYLWVWNGSTAPASTTTLTVGFVSVEDLPNTSVFLSGVRTNGNAPTLPVRVTSGVVDTVTTVTGVTTVSTVTNQGSAGGIPLAAPTLALMQLAADTLRGNISVT